MLNFITGKIDRPLKVVIYGTEGIGKSTLASKFPDPLFIDVEGGTHQLDVRRVQKPDTWDGLIALVAEVAKADGICKTLVIDTADWCETLCAEHICAKYNQKSIESFNYGKGYAMLGEEWGRLVAAMNAVIAAGIHVVVLAHARQRKIELPDQAGSFDHYELKLSRQVAPILKEWSDLLLFCNYETFVVTTDSNTRKATGGRRVMYTSHSPVYDAKNRHGLPEVMDLDYSGIAHLFGDAPKPRKPLDELRARMERDGITEEQVRQVVAQRGHYGPDIPITEYHEEFIAGWCLKHWQNIVNMAAENKAAGTKGKE